MTAIQTGQTSRQEIRRLFDLQKSNQYAVARTTAKERIKKLKRLQQAILDHRQEIRDAIHQDFKKPPTEVDLTEIYPTIKEIKSTIKNIRRWMKPKKVGTPIAMLGTSSYIQYQPKGVVLIISPWNFPVNLTFIPLVTAIAAGNCVILKPSEHTPHTSALMSTIVKAVFEEQEVALVEGAVDTSQALLELPFNHIFFTGTPSIGKIIMQAATKHLCSVTLELGGKSPTIIDETADINKAASRIAWGKFTNNGQTCIAPDYLLVHESKKEALLEALKKEITSFYGKDAQRSNDYARIVNPRHFERLSSYLDDAREKGASISSGGQLTAEECYIEPTLVVEPAKDSLLANEEIFGPILPIYTYDKLDEAIQYINKGEKPLALYVFSKSKKNIRKVINETRAGGTSVNHSVLHFNNNELPFGGDNNSGIGKSHGWFGFEAFSNARSILYQWSPFSATDLLTPPYSGWKQKLADITLKWL
jgi:aldehyde dehydrogenase (NAD+)